MDWKDIAGAVGKIAPILGPLLGGPIGAAATVGGMIASALGTDGTPDAVAAAINADPQAALKLREVESNNRVRLEELAVQRAAHELQAESEALKTAAADRDSARKREVSAADSVTPRVLAAVVIIGFLSMVYMVLAGYVQGMKDPAIVGMVGTLIGYVSAKADQVVSYYFGSSAGSARKDATIQAQANK